MRVGEANMTGAKPAAGPRGDCVHTESSEVEAEFSEVEADFSELIMQLARMLRRGQLSAVEVHGLAPHHVRALNAISRRTAADAETRLSDLAARLRIAPRSATDVVDALESKGLVQRAPSKTDRRAVVLTLTATGRTAATELHEQMRQLRGEQGRRLLAPLPPVDREQLTALLRRVAEHALADESGAGSAAAP